MKSLRVGDIVWVGEERLDVIKECVKCKSGGYCVRITRPHLKIYKLLKTSYYPDKVDVMWSLHQGYVPSDFTNWRVERKSV